MTEHSPSRDQAAAAGLHPVEVSVVIPMKNEAANVAGLLRGVAAALNGQSAEVIIIDDGSTDGTAAAALALAGEVPGLRVLSHDRSGGQSAAVHSGVRAALGRVVCTLDGDGQNPPAELPKLYLPLLADQSGTLGLVAGQRVARQDSWSKRAGSKLANALRRWLLNDGTRDTGCGLKGFRRDAWLALPYFNHMHRYLPALMRRDGWEVLLVDVSHRERQAGRSNYSNLQRAWVGIFDLMGVAWLIRRRKKARVTGIAPAGAIGTGLDPQGAAILADAAGGASSPADVAGAAKTSAGALRSVNKMAGSDDASRDEGARPGAPETGAGTPPAGEPR